VRTSIYIDGFNLYYGALKDRGAGFRWLDLGQFCRQLLPAKNSIVRIRYFTAPVSQRNTADLGPVHQQTYLRALATVPNLSIHLGRFLVKSTRMWNANPPPNTVEVIKTEEKGSDVNLATYLLRDGFKDEYDVAIVISNDSDLTAPIRILRQEFGKDVGVCSPYSKASFELKNEANFVWPIRAIKVQTSQFPATLTDSTGTISKPVGW